MPRSLRQRYQFLSSPEQEHTVLEDRARARHILKITPKLSVAAPAPASNWNATLSA